MFGLVAASRLAASEQALSEMRAINADLGRRYDALMTRYHDLVTRPSGPAPTKLPERKADPVSEAIAAIAGNDGRLRKTLGSWARKERLDGTMTEDEITHQILNWSDADSEAA